jgi:hypothetical protein
MIKDENDEDFIKKLIYNFSFLWQKKNEKLFSFLKNFLVYKK